MDMHVDPERRRTEESALSYQKLCINRYFLDRVATHILAFEDDGNVVWFEVRL